MMNFLNAFSILLRLKKNRNEMLCSIKYDENDLIWIFHFYHIFQLVFAELIFNAILIFYDIQGRGVVPEKCDLLDKNFFLENFIGID